MDKFWPGPLTLVFPAKNNISPVLTGGSGTIGIRISPHPLATRFVKEYGKPLTATSANLSGKSPAKSVEDIRRNFGDSIDFILENNSPLPGNCSTIVGIKNRKLEIFRQGVLNLENSSEARESTIQKEK
jgi:L-threonylcarbamoyladenylate synthase